MSAVATFARLMGMAVLACGVPCSVYAAQSLEVRAVSSRADTVSGGDVLVQVSAPNPQGWTAQLDGRDVTASFSPKEGSEQMLALLSGLKLGRNLLTIQVNRTIAGKLELLNHPIEGPVFSGAHQSPFVCQTVENGLGPALDPDCSAKTIVQYYYKSNEAVAESPAAMPEGAAVRLPSGFKPYPASAKPPSDVARIEIAEGRTVPYIVRREIGVINRAIYDIEILHQPGEPLPTPWTRAGASWNGRLVYNFGGGCGTGYHQGAFPFGASGDPVLSKGYALAMATLSIPANNCNDRIAAETLSMVREHFIKEYGEPVHTLGVGGSTGATQQHLIAQNYPGLLDGILVYGSFSDTVTGDAVAFTDCSLLEHSLEVAKQPWTEEQKAAVSGFATWHTCLYWSRFKLPIVDAKECAYRVVEGAIPQELVYDQIKNPQGVRCDIYDNEIQVFGRDPRRGGARRPLDNVGVQYGLRAFNRGQISAEQFIELNQGVGGYDPDGALISERTESDPEAIRVAYERGLVLTGGGGLGHIPIVDVRSYTDDLADAHDRYRSFVTRARLMAARGNADNQVILVTPRPELLPLEAPKLFPADFTHAAEQEVDLVQELDHWLNGVAADRAAGTPAAKLRRNKPPNLVDSCWTVDGTKIAEAATYDGPGKCNELYPSHGDPRIAAGGPLADDILKCALKPIRAADYTQPLNADQLARLEAAFPTGVCDYTRLGVGQQITQMTWQKF